MVQVSICIRVKNIHVRSAAALVRPFPKNVVVVLRVKSGVAQESDISWKMRDGNGGEEK
jgi:hypothetical protein